MLHHYSAISFLILFSVIMGSTHPEALKHESTPLQERVVDEIQKGSRPGHIQQTDTKKVSWSDVVKRGIGGDACSDKKIKKLKRNE